MEYNKQSSYYIYTRLTDNKIKSEARMPMIERARPHLCPFRAGERLCPEAREASFATFFECACLEGHQWRAINGGPSIKGKRYFIVVIEFTRRVVTEVSHGENIASRRKT